GGRFPIKRAVGESVHVRVDLFADGHDLLAGVLRYRKVPGTGGRAERAQTPQASAWHEVPLAPGDNDSWSASFTVIELGEYEYTVAAWIDRFATWAREVTTK